MARVRKDAWKHGGTWSDPTLLWYARGVREMMKLPIKDPLSWRYQAAMHGFNEALWRNIGYLAPTDQLPDAAQRHVYWEQCQHQTWYFLPWHRGYLSAFEKIVRDQIIRLGGPADWALPYWNYFGKGGAHRLPPCFTDHSWPDGGPNPLFVQLRFGQGADLDYINLYALREMRFDGAGGGGNTGFGGVATAFQHYGGYNGKLESNPHNLVHTEVGTGTSGKMGLMSNPNTAALDPIFWLHHANIDRLWETWRLDPNHRNPTDAAWLHGPADRKFAAWRPNRTPYTFDAQEMLNTLAPNLDYTYEDLAPATGPGRLERRLERLNIAQESLAAPMEIAAMSQSQAELIAASDAPLALGATPVHARLQVDRLGVSRTLASLKLAATASAAAPVKEPDRVFLNLENIRGNTDAAVYRVYVGVPHHEEQFVGAVSMFGVAKASDPNGTHGANGVSEAIEITDAIDTLHKDGVSDLGQLGVRLEPATRIDPEHQISVGRISIYRQGS